jgi:site-specific DNA-methyltransferase (adenine-specific)/modification methylase
LKSIADESVDLIFADPPYNLQLNRELYRPNQTKVDAVSDKWDKFESKEKYDEFSNSWLKECYRVLKKSGSFWVIGTYHNIFRVGSIMQNIGFWMLNDIIWIKTNPMPNFKGTRFNNAHETLIWATKSAKSCYTFHYHAMKTMNDDLQMRSDWFIPICNGKERIKINGKKAHSAQKPAELLYRIIMSTSNLDDLVLDPFMGSGTTAAVAKKLGRNFIGFEKKKTYINVANNMLKKIVPIKKELLLYKIETKKPKVTFGNLIEKGYVKIGEKLYSEKKDKEAVVQADASIESGNEIGSIHKISAKILNKESNNGWDFWYVLKNNELISIDSLRYAYKGDFFNKSEADIEFNGNCVKEPNDILLKYVAESKEKARNKM